jgi:hypothetical protein
MKKSFGYVMAAPIITVGIMYMAKEVKKETSMTTNFVYGIRRLQESAMGSNYSRSSSQVGTPDPLVRSDDSG